MLINDAMNISKIFGKLEMLGRKWEEEFVNPSL